MTQTHVCTQTPDPIVVYSAPDMAAEQLARYPALCVDQGQLCIELRDHQGCPYDPRDIAPVLEVVPIQAHAMAVVVTPFDIFVLPAATVQSVFLSL